MPDWRFPAVTGKSLTGPGTLSISGHVGWVSRPVFTGVSPCLRRETAVRPVLRLLQAAEFFSSTIGFLDCPDGSSWKNRNSSEACWLAVRFRYLSELQSGQSLPPVSQSSVAGQRSENRFSGVTSSPQKVPIMQKIHCLTTALLLTFCLELLPSRISAQDNALLLRKDEHIAYIGNTLADRMQHHGWLETYIQALHPDLNLTFRNLGYSADEVKRRDRANNFGSPDQWLTKVKADTIFCFFGRNEALNGDAGLAGFRKDLAAMLDGMLAQKYNSKSAPRIILFSPIAHENLNSPHLPERQPGKIHSRDAGRERFPENPLRRHLHTDKKSVRRG